MVFPPCAFKFTVPVPLFLKKQNQSSPIVLATGRFKVPAPPPQTFVCALSLDANVYPSVTEDVGEA